MSTPEKKGLQPDMIVAICAVIVGLCALGVSFYQTLIMREQQRELSEQRRAEMWPNVEMGVSNQGETVYFLVVNSGIGPARIESIRLRHKGVPFQAWGPFIEGLLKEETQYGYQQSQMSNRVLPAGETIEGLVLKGELALLVGEAFYDIEAEICYCSIYSDCWVYAIGIEEQRLLNEVAACTRSEHDFLQ